ncbi:MAG: hypothetical protein ACP5U1_05990 [Desulfomonilaceae bacterium]
MNIQEKKSVRACIALNSRSKPSEIIEFLGSFEIAAEIFESHEEALVKQKEDPFDLLIVHDDPSTGQGLKLIEEFLKTNWMTSAILVCDQDESAVHDRAEGLGILGHIRNIKDLEGLNELLTKFKQISPSYS